MKRKKIGWTQNKLAKEAGVSRSLISKAEQCPEKLKLSYFKARSILNVLDAQLLATKTKTKQLGQ